MSDGIGYLADLADLSEAKRADLEHATLAENVSSAQRVSLLLEAAPDAILEVDRARPHPARIPKPSGCFSARARNCSVCLWKHWFRSVFAAGISRIATITRLTRCAGPWAPEWIYSRSARMALNSPSTLI